MCTMTGELIMVMYVSRVVPPLIDILQAEFSQQVSWIAFNHSLSKRTPLEQAQNIWQESPY